MYRSTARYRGGLSPRPTEGVDLPSGRIHLVIFAALVLGFVFALRGPITRLESAADQLTTVLSSAADQ